MAGWRFDGCQRKPAGANLYDMVKLRGMLTKLKRIEIEGL